METNVTVIFMNLSFLMGSNLLMRRDDLKVRALRGDDFEKISSIPAGVSYTKATAGDLPAENTIQNLFSGDNAIGTIPATTFSIMVMISYSWRNCSVTSCKLNLILRKTLASAGFFLLTS